MNIDVGQFIILVLVIAYISVYIWLNCRRKYLIPHDEFTSIRIDNLQETHLDLMNRTSRSNGVARNLCSCFNSRSYRSPLFFKKAILYNSIKDRNDPNEIKKFFSIRRSNLLEDSYDKFMSVSSEHFKKMEVEIRFNNEKGRDYGGIYKDWIGSIIDLLLNSETGLFEITDNKKAIISLSKPNVDLKYYKFFGRLIARLIIDKNIANVCFDDILYKQILNREITENDFRSADPSYYEILQSVKKDPTSSNLTFTNAFSENLKENGEFIMVTESNVESFITLSLENKYITGIEEKIRLIRDGLFEIIDEDLFRDWTPEEFKLLICGLQKIDVRDWKSKTEYYGFNKRGKTIVWFWEIVSEFSEEEKMDLLHFVTGASSVPSEGFGFLSKGDGRQLRFLIRKLDFYRLPRGHTCTNTLDLAIYKTKAKLREDLEIVIAHSNNEFDLE